jgi:hypothetical protein
MFAFRENLGQRKSLSGNGVAVPDGETRKMAESLFTRKSPLARAPPFHTDSLNSPSVCGGPPAWRLLQLAFCEED